MKIVEWNNTTGLKTAVDANKSTEEDIVFRLTEDFTGRWETGSWSGFATDGLTLIIDLNGFKITPSSMAPMSTYSSPTKGVAMFIFSDTTSADSVYGVPSTYPLVVGKSNFNGNFIIENGTIDISGIKEGAGKTYAILIADYKPQFSYTGTLTLRRLNIGINPAAPIIDHGHSTNSVYNFNFNLIEIYSCVINGSRNTKSFCYGSGYTYATTPKIVEDCMFSSTSSPIFSMRAPAEGYKYMQINRTYCNLASLYAADGGGTITLPTTDYIHSNAAPFNETTFYSLAVSDELFLVPREGTALTTSIGQDSIIPSELNTVGLNRIRSTDGNRVIGPMGMPDIVDGPSGMTMQYNSADITISWTPNTDPSITKTEVFIDEYETGDFKNKLASVPIATTSVDIPYSSMYPGKVSYIKLRHA